MFPTYLALGMSYDQYWNDTPYLAVAYREAHRIKYEYENSQSWWLGVYVRQAVQSALSCSLPWFKKPIDYPQKPLRVTPLTPEEKEEEARKEREKAIRSFNAWKDAWDRKNAE